MPKITSSKNRIIIHVGVSWKRVDREKYGYDWRTHDVGRGGFTQRIVVRRRIGNIAGNWQTYAWSFTKDQITVSGRTLLCKDKNAYDILSRMKREGDLKGYKVEFRR